MKTTLLASCLLAVIAISFANELKAKIMGNLADCKKDFKLEDDAINKVLSMQQVPQTQDGKCLLACVLKKLEFIVGNKYNWEKSVAMNKYKFSNEEDVKKADVVVKKCGEMVKENSDECALASDIAQCAHDESTKAGLPIPKWV